MNKYEKIAEIGEGTFGVVLKCRHKETNELVAIKKFKESSEEDEASRKVTLREVKLLRALKHEHIVELKEAFRRKGVLYLVFEHMDQSVMDVLEAKPTGLGKDTVKVLIFQLLRALEHCHRHNVIHRDIKPENLLVNSAVDSLRLCDFGCARQIKADVALTDYVATRWYRPPELLLSSDSYGKPVDMWGLGCIMGELTDGQPLFAGKSDIDQLCVIQKILGPLTAKQMERFLELSNFKGVQFPDITQPVTLQKRYAGKMSEDHMLLLTQLLVMDEDQRLSAKAALRSSCFKDMKGIHPDKPPKPSVQKENAAGGDAQNRALRSERPPLQPSPCGENFGSKNTTPHSTGMPDMSVPSKAAKPRRKSSTRDEEMPPLMKDIAKAAKPRRKNSDRDSEMPPLVKSPACAAEGPARAAAALPQIGLSAGAKAAKKDPRMSQENFSFKKEGHNGEESRLPGNFTMNDWNTDASRITPQAQAASAYRLPWESQDAADDGQIGEFGDTPTPIFGKSSKGFFADARVTGGVAGGGAAKNTQAPIAQVAKWGNAGSRWSGA